MTDLAQGTTSHVGFQLKDDLLFYKGRLVIPHSSSFVPMILAEFHSSLIGGHSAETKMYQRIASELYWVGMHSYITKFVVESDICQRNKGLNTTPAGLLQPIPLPLQVWDEVTMDFIEGLPKAEGYSSLLVVVDRLSKYVHFLCLRHLYSAQTVAALFHEGDSETPWCANLNHFRSRSNFP